MATETSAWYVLQLLYTYWRGLIALSILCNGGDAKAYSFRMGEETDTYAFFVSVYQLT